MGNLLMKCGFKRLKRKVILLLVGLDNAGKTTAAKGIVGDDIGNIVPTVGFVPMNLSYRGCSITIYDLGGGSRIREVWTKYFAEVYGVIFVIDSSDQARVEEGKLVLSQLLSDTNIAGKPVLILANKQDVDGAMDEIDVVEALDIENIVNEHRCPTRVEMCSATNILKKKPDKPIADGFRWLVDTIILQYGLLEKRVQRDMLKMQQKFLKELEERRERVHQYQLEREKEEKLKETKIDESPSHEVIFHHQDSAKKVVENVANNSVAIYRPAVESKKKPTHEEEFPPRLVGTPNSLEGMKELGVTSKFSSGSESTLSDGTLSTIDSESPQIIYVKSSSVVSDDKSVSQSASGRLLSTPSSATILRQETTEVNLVPSHYSNVLTDGKKDSNISRDSPVKSQNSVVNAPAHFNGSITSAVIDNLELEVSLSNRKRKPILKRLNKTAPSPTVVEERIS